MSFVKYRSCLSIIFQHIFHNNIQWKSYQYLEELKIFKKNSYDCINIINDETINSQGFADLSLTLAAGVEQIYCRNRSITHRKMEISQAEIAFRNKIEKFENKKTGSSSLGE